ncbi:MAG TPA: ATP-binding protein [Polyangia bacterium]|jgi:signal transduction histidine kinase|nr:ATP-binding protein [Polyangia bacterium]
MKNDTGSRARRERGASFSASSGASPGASSSASSSSSSSRRFIAIGFSLVGILLAGATVSAIMQTRRLQEHTRDIVDDMLGSVQLIGELDASVERRRILVDDHIFATNRGEMLGLEGDIATLNAKIAEIIRAYDRWAVLPGERALWQRAQADLRELDPPIRRALAASRDNHDIEARRIMEEVTEPFARLDRDLDDLIAINNRGAGEDLTRFSMIRLRLTMTLIAIGLVALAGTVIIAVWASRQVGRREDELHRVARLLEERNRELDAFAGRVAHDIRGPLTAITLAMKPLESKVPEGDRSLEILRRGAKTMGALIDDLLALARTNAEMPGWCDPADVARDVEDEMGPRLGAVGGKLLVTVAPAGVACTEGLLRQALVNLVENSLKYRRPEAAPVVQLSGAPRADGVGYELGVTDNGVGMSPEEIQHATEPFYRSPRARALPGTGLGLSIVDRVARACGGKLSVSSEPGRGSTFVMRLPIAAAPALSRSSAAAPSPRSPTSTDPR